MRTKRLRSVVHSTAQFAMSSMHCLHPSLGQEYTKQNCFSATIDLRTLDYDPPLRNVTSTIEHGAKGLNHKFEEILKLENIDKGEVKSIFSSFQFKQNGAPSACLISVKTTDGETIETAIDFDGKPATVFRHDC